MDFYQRKNTCAFREVPAIRERQTVLFILTLFFLYAGIVIVSPVTALDPYNQTRVESLISKAGECYENGDRSCTFAAYESAHLLDPDNAYILFYHGLYLSDAGNAAGALEKVDAALVLDPENAWMWQEKGKILDKLGRFIESGTSYDRAGELDPGRRVPPTKRFPLNFLIGNATIIVVVGGFFLLGIYIYFNERKRL